MKKFLLSFFILISFCLHSSEIMRLAAVRPGMEGIGKTVFKGTKVETFSFKVLGFIEKFAAGKDLIIVEIDSPVLNNGGILQGMSGSPLYIDGKIIGAVAYGFSFSKKPIAGVTPIEDIIATSSYSGGTGRVAVPGKVKFSFDKKNLAAISDKLKRTVIDMSNFSPAKGVSPIKLIGTSRGIGDTALKMMEPVFASAQKLNASRLSKQNILKRSRKDNIFSIKPADAVAVSLIKGDFEYSASGTVSYVDGNKVYAFGHPFYNLGKVSFPMHKAEVISVVPSYQSGFKLTSSGEMIGTMVQDRFSAIHGVLGQTPYMIPVKVFMKDRNKRYSFEMVDHKVLTPYLTAVSIANIFSSEYFQIGISTLKVKGKIFIEGEKNIILDDIYSGPSSVAEFSNLLVAINYFVMNNREKSVKIQKIDLEIEVKEKGQHLDLENVILNRNSYRAGEIINVKMDFRSHLGKTASQTIGIKAPNLKNGSVFYVMAADKLETSLFDSKNVRSSYFPRKLSALIRGINNIRKNSRVYVKIISPAKGLFIKGHEYANIPDSMNNMFLYNSSSGDKASIQYSTHAEYQLEVPAVVKGKKLFKLIIKER